MALKVGDAVANARGQVITESAMTVFVQGKLDESKDYIVYLMVENEAGLWSELASLPLTTEDITVIDPDTSNGKNQGIAIDQDLILTMDISEITDRTAVLTITTNQDGTVYYLIQKASIEAPVDLINHSDRISVDVTHSTPWTTVLESLSPNTEYIIYSLVVGNGNPSKIVSQTFTTADTLKQVQPEVTLISAELVSEGVNLTFESNQGGTYYCLIQESYQEAPEALAIKAQQNGLGKATGQVTTASSMTVFVDALLDAGEQYTAYLVAENEKGLLSDVVSLPLTEKQMMLMGAATGTPEISWYTANPTAETFEIYNADQLAGMALLLSKTSPMDVNGFSGKTIRLMDDIDLSAYQSGTGWLPIGKYDSLYGTFDGNGKTITGLTITGEVGSNQGLFGTLNGGTIKNLMLKEVSITVDKDFVGGLVGSIQNGGIVDTCYVSGTISSENGWGIGGIAGRATGTVRNCVSTVNVSGLEQVGGVVGRLTGTVESCYATGIVTADANAFATAGGIVGYAVKNDDDHCSIENCAALNTSVTGVSEGTHRILGGTGGSLKNTIGLSNNYGNSSMLINGAVISGGSVNPLGKMVLPVLSLLIG